MGRGGGGKDPPVCGLGTRPSTWVLGDQFLEQRGGGIYFGPKLFYASRSMGGRGVGGLGSRISRGTERNGVPTTHQD